MAFDRYKSKHGGQGPFAAFYEAATGGHGLFGRLGLKDERDLTNELIGRVQQSEDLESLSAAAEAGRAPMTRGQHAEFRAGMLQAAANIQVAEEGYRGFTQNQAGLRSLAVGPEDIQSLDLLDTQGSYAHKLMQSADPALQAQGRQLMGDVQTAQRQFSAVNETQRIQLEEAEKNDRNGRRQEIQGFVDSRIVGPLIEDKANFEAIGAQLLGEPAEVAPPSLVSAVLEYAGASLRQSDDGNWSFSLGPLGIRDTDLPAMTYSQLRNRLNSAQQGREQSMRGALDLIGEQAQKQGFGINGASVNDLLFPLAEAAYRSREAETVAPSPTEQLSDVAESATSVLTQKESDFENPIPLGQAFQTFFRPDLQARPGESQEAYRARLAEARGEGRQRPVNGQTGGQF